MKRITIRAQSIDDLPPKEKKEPKIDFHALIPVSLYNKFTEASDKTGYNRNELLILALESFFTNKKP